MFVATKYSLCLSFLVLKALNNLNRKVHSWVYDMKVSFKGKESQVSFSSFILFLLSQESKLSQLMVKGVIEIKKTDN